jgi:endonuclease III
MISCEGSRASGRPLIGRSGKYNRGVKHAKERAADVVRTLERLYPKATFSLDFRNPYELLVATILAAQSTDKKINEVTKKLFARYPTVNHLAAADRDTLEGLIRQTGYYRAKANSLLGASRAIVEKHAGEVPQTMEELVTLPGVGRKTANVVLSNAFGKTAGIVVDTHMTRVAGRLGFTGHADAQKIEADLMVLIPRKKWIGFAHRMIVHGRQICVARKPKCSECLLNELCPSAEAPLE